MVTNRISRTLLTGRRGRLAAVAVAAALVPATALAGSSVRAQAALHDRPATAGDVSTIAGGVGGPAKATTVGLGIGRVACGLTFADGYLYIGGGTTVRRVDPSSDWLTTVAGSSSAAPAGNLGLAKKGSLRFPCGVAVDHAGNVVITDSSQNRVWVVAASSGSFYGQAMTAGHIYRVAGTGRGYYTGDGGPATSADLHFPEQTVVDGSGNLVIADTDNQRIRVVAESNGTFYGQAMTAGDIYTIAGYGHKGHGGDGLPATRAALHDPFGVALDAAGNLLIDDSENSRIRVVAASDGTFYGKAMTTGYIYNVAGTGTEGYSGDGGPAWKAELNNPFGVAVDGAGNVLIADTYNERIRVVAESTGMFYGQPMSAGHIYTVAGDGNGGSTGDGGPATSADIGQPFGVGVDGAGNLVIGNGTVRLVAVTTGTFYGQAMTAGDIYTIAGIKTGFSGDGGLATRAELKSPNGVKVDGAGDVLIADSGEYRVAVVAASTGTRYGQKMRASHIYTIAGDGTQGYSGDGGPATSAEINPAEQGSEQLAADGAGNLVIADTNNNRIRVVAVKNGTFYKQKMTAGDIYTIAGDGTQGYSGDGGPATSAELSFPDGVAVDGAGNVLIADARNARIRVVAARSGTFYGQKMTRGHIYTVAGDGTLGYAGDGGPATSAELTSGPVAVDGAGNLVIGDIGNERIRVVAASTGTFYGQAMTAGEIYTVAGDGTYGYAGDGGPATSAEFRLPYGVAVDGAGNLVIADTNNLRVRLVAATTGTFYGQAMTAGDIYTIAGDGKTGFTGGLGPHAELALPTDVAVNAAGNVMIADSLNNRIRMVTADTGKGRNSG